jgi:release factor glutamine methyltransferase
VDVGTGSGAIALALKDERPDLEVLATDVSADALAVARANADRLGLEVSFTESDLLGAVDGPLDAVLSNPPYVRIGDPSVMPDVRMHEPDLALYGGPEGDEVLRRLVTEAAARGVRLLAVELGEGQAQHVAELARAAGFGEVEIRRDLAGIERVVVAREH